MQREIKFRAWDKFRRKMCSHEDIKIWDRFMEDDMSNQYAPLMQYTGLKDKNGKEIYEGDIVEYEDYSGGLYLFKKQPKARGVIKINNLLSGIYLKGMGTFEESKVEVIGNIHDNPELLEEVFNRR